MKKSRVFKKVFAILSVVLLMSLFVINTFAYSVPFPDDHGQFIFNSENVLTYNNIQGKDYVGDGNTIVCSRGLGYTAYYCPNTPMQVFTRFEDEAPIILEPGQTYVIFWFVLSAGADFSANNFKVFDGQMVFPRGATQYNNSVSNLSLRTVDGTIVTSECYYNIVDVDRQTEIYSLACDYTGTLSSPVVFIPFLVELDDYDFAWYIGEGGTLTFYTQSYYDVVNAQYSASQLQHLLTLQNSTVYNYDQGYHAGFAEGLADKNQYGAQMREQGYQDGVRFEKENQVSNLMQAKQEGYDIGYQDGVNSGGLNLSFSNMILSVLESPFQVAQTMLDFELLGINLANFFFSLITLIIVVKVITLKS